MRGLEATIRVVSDDDLFAGKPFTVSVGIGNEQHPVVARLDPGDGDGFD